MKYVAFAALSFFSVFASANELADNTAASDSARPLTQVEQYNRHKGLDVAKVSSVTTAQDPEKVDGLVKSSMVYVDSKGATHTLEYTTMGYGRQNG